MSSAKTWFVQTGFGATLGPMPVDALLEMVRTGALIRTDQVRAGDEDQWHLASEISELTEIFSDGSVSTAQSVADEAIEVVAPTPVIPTSSPPIPLKVDLIAPPRPMKLQPPSAPVEVSVPLPVSQPEAVPSVAAIAKNAGSDVAVPAVQPEVVTEPVTDSHSITPLVAPHFEDDLVSSTAPPEDDLIANWKSQRLLTKEEMGLVSLAVEMTRVEEEEDFAPELPADLLDDEPVSASLETVSPKPASRPMTHRPAFLDQVAGLEDGPRQRVETSREKWDRWRRSMPSWPIAVAVVLVLWGAWSFWPRSHRGFYHRYVAIWDEWKARRTDFKDKDGWESFLKRTAAELDDTVPWLEKHASAKDHDQLLLLWVGRDCFRKMLKQPRQIGSPEEKQLQILLTRLRDFYESPGSAVPDRGQAAGKNADPEQSNAAVGLEPSSVRTEPKPEEAALPAKPDLTPSAQPDER
jgi:hypothetical protein